MGQPLLREDKRGLSFFLSLPESLKKLIIIFPVITFLKFTSYESPTKEQPATRKNT